MARQAHAKAAAAVGNRVGIKAQTDAGNPMKKQMARQAQAKAAAAVGNRVGIKAQTNSGYALTDSD